MWVILKYYLDIFLKAIGLLFVHKILKYYIIKKNLYLEFPLVVLLVLISVLFCIMQNVVTLTRLSISKIAVFVSNNIVLCHCDLINNSYNVPSFLLCTYTMYRSWNLNWASYGSTYRRPRKFKHPINKVNTTINGLLDRLSLS